MSAVAFIVGRLHVGTSDTEVVREFVRRCRKRGVTFSKAERKAIYREALKHHHANRQMYRHVMMGRF